MLDIVENSISAGATLITVCITVAHEKDYMSISVTDNGCGLDEKMAKEVTSPFITSRTTRKVGLGIPMFKAGAEECEGDFSLTSKLGEGTVIKAGYRISNIDRPPLGDIAETMLTLVVCNTSVDFVFEYDVDAQSFCFDTREIKQTLGADVPLNLPQIIAWMRDCLKEGIEELNGGV